MKIPATLPTRWAFPEDNRHQSGVSRVSGPGREGAREVTSSQKSFPLFVMLSKLLLIYVCHILKIKLKKYHLYNVSTH